MPQQPLDAVRDAVSREYDAHERRAEALDTKAGLVLGFAGLLVSVTPPELSVALVVAVRSLAAAAAMAALAAFSAQLPTRRDVTSPRHEQLPSGILELLRTNALASARVLTKTRRIHASLRLLGVALATIVTGTVATVLMETAR